MRAERWHDLPASMVGIYCATAAEPQNPRYNTAELIEISGSLDYQVLEAALHDAYSEHEAIGAEFCQEEIKQAPQGLKSKQGTPQWRARTTPEDQEQRELIERCRLPEQQNQFEAVSQWCYQRAQQPLDVFNGKGVDAVLIEMGQRTWLYHAAHHLIADGYAVHTLLGRWAQLYREGLHGQSTVGKRSSLAELTIQSQEQADRALQDRQAWIKKLAEEDLSADTSVAQATAPASFRPYRSRHTVSQQLQASLLKASKDFGVGWSQLLTAALGSYLARAARSEVSRLAVPLMNRTLAGSKASALTLCSAVNLLPLAVPSSGDVKEHAQKVAQEMAFAQGHPLARYEDLERITASRGRLTGAQINIVPFESALDFGGGTTGRIHNLLAGPVENITVCLRGMPRPGADLSLEVDCNPALYSLEESHLHGERILSWLEQYAQLCGRGGELDQLKQATASERTALEEFNRTAHDVNYQPLAARFLEFSRRQPEDFAVIEAAPYDSYGSSETEFGHRTLTYQQLADLSLRYAGALQSYGVSRQDTVGLRVERGLEQFILLYALLHLGAVYLPLDPALPAGRISSMCQDAQASLICQGPGVAPLEGQMVPELVSWQELTERAVALGPEELIEAGAGSSLQAHENIYALFTSGSTGRPKGVITSAGALANRLAWQQDLLRLEEGERVLHKTPISFDVHIWELYWPLTQGATVVVAAPGGHRDPQYLAGILEQGGADLVHFVPSMLAAYLDSLALLDSPQAGKQGPRAFICSGEQLPASSVLQVHRRYQAPVHNFYGPTEAAIDVTAFSALPGSSYSQVPIGRPVWNTGLSIRDLAGQECPPGVVGELHLHGVQVASGYLQRPELSQASFYLDCAGEPSYRTGDLAYWDSQGNVYYRGRADNQVKIRGQRVDLGEIETVLAGHPNVSNVAVLYLPERLDALVAFVELRQGCTDTNPADYATYTGQELPDYMIPNQWIFGQELPLTPNGKIDRKSLRNYYLEQAEHDQPSPTISHQVKSLLEEEICAIYSTLLGFQAGPDTDFFAQGGNSLAALNLLASLERQTGKKGSFSQIFTNPTPRLLAQALESNEADDFVPLLSLRQSLDREQKNHIVFVPPAGGLGWCYHTYLPYLPARKPIWALQAAAYRDPQAPGAGSIEQLARDYIGVLHEAGIELEGLTLLGWSLGGMVAQEMVYQLEQAALAPGRLILLDAYPQELWRRQKPPTEDQKWQALVRMGGLETAETGLTRSRVVELLEGTNTALGSLGDAELNVCIDQVHRAMELVRLGDPSPIVTSTTLLSALRSQEKGLEPESWASYCANYGWVQVAQEHVDLVKPQSFGGVLQKIFDQA